MNTDQKPKISICTTLLSRRDDPIHNFRIKHCNEFLMRFEKLNKNNKAELIVALWPCDDIDLKCDNSKLRTIPMTGHFNVNSGHNASSNEARADILFFCDTDLILPFDSIDILLENTKKGQCFFPIWESETEDKSKIIWRVHSYGNASFHIEDFKKIGKFNEKQAVSWGGDIDIFNKASKTQGLRVIRENWKGLWHQWHPKPNRNFYNKVDDKTKY